MFFFVCVYVFLPFCPCQFRVTRFMCLIYVIHCVHFILSLLKLISLTDVPFAFNSALSCSRWPLAKLKPLLHVIPFIHFHFWVRSLIHWRISHVFVHWVISSWFISCGLMWSPFFAFCFFIPFCAAYAHALLSEYRLFMFSTQIWRSLTIIHSNSCAGPPLCHVAFNISVISGFFWPHTWNDLASYHGWDMLREGRGIAYFRWLFQIFPAHSDVVDMFSM